MKFFDSFTTDRKLYSLIVVLAIALVVILGQVIRVSELGPEKASYTTNSGELVKGVVVGQTFVSTTDMLSGVAVMFATYSNRNNTEPVEFHLRQSITDSKDIRSGTVMPSALGDNQYYRFNFDPIADSKGKTYFFYLISPGSIHNDAVTVDLDTRDPYHSGSAYIARIPAGEVLDPAQLARSGKPTIDVVFQTFHNASLAQATYHAVRDNIYWFIGTWHDRRGNYFLWAKFALVAVVYVALAFILRKYGEVQELSPKAFRLVFLTIFVVAVLMRLMYAVNMPLTSDEGNYLYDAHTLLLGHLAGGDGYVKSLVVILWLSLWELILGHTVLAGRVASVVIGALTVIPIYFIGREMRNRYTGLLSAASWAVFGGVVVSNIYVHTQSVALFFGISGVAVAWMAVRGHIGKQNKAQIASSFKWFVLAGILLGLGVASRKSILALGLLPLAAVLIENSSFKARFKQLIAIGIGFTIVLALLFGFAYKAYGPEGLWEVTGINSAGDAANAELSEASQVREYSIRGMTPFFRESTPMILLALLGWGLLLENVVWTITRRLFASRPGYWISVLFNYIIPKLVWVLPVLVFMWARGFFFEYEGSAFLDMGGMRWLWYAITAMLALIALWPRSRDEKFVIPETKNETNIIRSTQPIVQSAMPPNVVAYQKEKMGRSRPSSAPVSFSGLGAQITAVLVPFLWLGGLTFFYINWIKFHANYIIEFLPPLAIMSGVGVYLAYQRLFDETVLVKWARFVAGALFAFVMLWAIYLSGYITYVFEHTGTFNLASIEEAAAWAKQNIPKDQPIFTGAAVVPYVSGHRVALDIAHPRWYAYQFTRDNPERLKAFLPTPNDMLNAYRNAQWFLMDSQTGFSFLMEYSEIEGGLTRDWVAVKGIENGSNTLTFYKRIR